MPSRLPRSHFQDFILIWKLLYHKKTCFAHQATLYKHMYVLIHTFKDAYTMSTMVIRGLGNLNDDYCI